MRQIGDSNQRRGRAQVYLNDAYDVVAQNGIIMGSVRYAFINGDGLWCIAITGHNGMPYHGKSYHETGSLFDLMEGEPTWTMPVQQPKPKFDFDETSNLLSDADWAELLKAGTSPGFNLLTGGDHATDTNVAPLVLEHQRGPDRLTKRDAPLLEPRHGTD